MRQESKRTLDKVFLVLFVSEHVLLLAASAAALGYWIFVLGPLVRLVATQGDGPGSGTEGHGHPILATLLIGVWLAPLAYSVLVPWIRRRLDALSIIGAVLTMLLLGVLAILDRIFVGPLVLYTAVVMLPALVPIWEWRAVRNAGLAALRGGAADVTQ